MKLKLRPQKLLYFIVISTIYALSISAQNGLIVREKFHGRSLENTVTNESPDRSLSIYLPPDYETSVNKRYPVIYLLHGIVDTEESFTKGWDKNNPGYSSIQDLMNKGIAAGKFGEMIVVMPDQKTNWMGSFYVNSTATGNWDEFTSKELVNYIDGKYRTLAGAKSRGIAGHSMGGYGAIVLSMKHPDVFSVAYALNPAIMDWGGDLTIRSPSFEFFAVPRTIDDVLKSGNLYNTGVITVSQAFSPNPDNPPFYVDFPFKMIDGKMRPNEPAFSKWRANSPIRMVENYRQNLNSLTGLRFDSGYEDEFRFIPVNSRKFSAELTNNGIEHIFEEYNGDHRNRLWGAKGRIYNEVLPYFWMLLEH